MLLTPKQKHRAVAKAALMRLTLGAMLAAMSVVIGMFCKSFLNFGGGLWRVTFENLPIILAGIFLGPITGGMVGVVSDLTSYLLSPQIYPPTSSSPSGPAWWGSPRDSWQDSPSVSGGPSRSFSPPP